MAHRADAVSLVNAFFDWAGKTVTKLSAKSELAEAFRYTNPSYGIDQGKKARMG